uniref:Uncharacterized protein LOC113785511 n=1 Tax=Cicer arietinum TaxID=3827 RepID=A0A3Q7YD18_CICAR|nr:uncharacterized protein LOC113785511 [Cicer arietinum]
MDSVGSSSHALPLTDVTQDDFIANQKKLPSSSSIEEHESLQQHSLMPTNADGVIVAMPVAYKKANEDTIIYIEGPRKSRKKTKAYAYDTTMWAYERRARNDGKKFDNVYIHKTENFQCRSLQEVERYEKEGERPSQYNRKKKQLKKNGETPNVSL